METTNQPKKGGRKPAPKVELIQEDVILEIHEDEKIELIEDDPIIEDEELIQEDQIQEQEVIASEDTELNTEEIQDKKPDPEDSWILCTNGSTNKLFPPALVNSKEFTKITKFKPVEINKL